LEDKKQKDQTQTIVYNHMEEHNNQLTKTIV